MKKPEIISTGDGSHSLYLPDLDETYHSRHGALQESAYVFLKMGLEFLLETGEQDISILEIGMGTGLNVWLTLMEAEKKNLAVHLTTLEPFPLGEEITDALNYTDGFSAEQKKWFSEIHSSRWESSQQLTNYFSLKKLKIKIQDFHPDEKFNLVYYDAFAPSKQEEMWESGLLFKLTDWLKPGGVVVTYCAKGQFKRDLAAAGFEVETLPGPPGKKEMVRGVRK